MSAVGTNEWTQQASRMAARALTRGLLALSLLTACDKLAPRENVHPGGGTPPPVDGNPFGDSSVFNPFEDAGSSDSGATDDGGGPEGPTCPSPRTDRAFDKQALVDSFAECAAHVYCEFEGLAQIFAEKAAAFAEAPSDSARREAQQAWAFALRAWQEAELFRFGPAADATEMGGKDLRNAVYAYPNVSRCRVDEQLVNQAYREGNFASSLPTARGLGAAEYLLYYDGSSNACSQFSTINGKGTWAALSANELAARRRAYAAAVAANVRDTARELSTLWNPEGGSFYAEFTQAGRASSTYPALQSALNAVSNALFYMEVELRDTKLGVPAGITSTCNPVCPDLVESFYAQLGNEFLKANLRGFRRLYQGCGPSFEGLGFDDWLREAGATSVADRMLAALDGIDAAIAALDPSFERTLVQDPAKVVAAFEAVRELTNLLKGEFLQALGLAKPMALEDDND